MTILKAEHWVVATKYLEVPVIIDEQFGIRKPTILIDEWGSKSIKGTVEYTERRAIEVAKKLTASTGIQFIPMLISEVIERTEAEEKEIAELISELGVDI